jgi:hypothetical protein
MTNPMGPATESGSVAGPESGAGGVSVGATTVSPPRPGPGDQDVVPFVSQVPGTPVSFPTFHGRTVSWVTVTLIMAAFLAGGLGLVFGPIWWLFWVGLGVAALGALLAVSTGIFDDWY